MFKESDYAGIDYSLGQSNYDPNNPEYHYGVISQHSLTPYFYDDLQCEYAEYCPHCGMDLDENWDDENQNCPRCHHEIIDGDQYSEEPSLQYISDGEYYAELLSNGELFLLKSEYYTFSQYCSPCFPGAGNLDTYCPNGVKTYCFSHDWFEDSKAPYPVYRVSDGSLVNL